MENVYLVGSEEVRHAGRAMRSAAETIGNVSTNFQVVLEAHQRFMTDWLERFEAAVDKHVTAIQSKESIG